MRINGRFVLFFVGALLAPFVGAHAQTVKVSPTGYITDVVGSAKQFQATVTGLSPTTVTWAVQGIAGGNATSGTISTTGLYKAPAIIPGQNPVQITATSTANTGISDSQYVNLIPKGPKITAVSPNPVPVGNVNVTITGVGIQPNATVTMMYTGVNEQLSTTATTSTTVTANGYLGSVNSVSFSVKNTGTGASNTLTVPTSGGPPTFKLTVVNGSGTGTYPVGKLVSITAHAPPVGSTFWNWTGADSAGVTDINAASTKITVPSHATTITANYTTAPRYQLTVNSGTGGGSYVAGAVVNIKANAPPAGKAFAAWTGSPVANVNSSTTTITMPAAAATVTATYGLPPPKFTLTVQSGTGSGSYAANTVVNISANAPPAGQQFQYWTGATVANANSSNTTLTMPAAAATVTANYAPITPSYSLTVVSGSGSGSYHAGTVVNISANAPPAGQIFGSWTGATVQTPTSSSTTLTMPAVDTTVTANFVVPGPIPFPVATHPRLWLTPTRVAQLQGWAVPTNPIWQQGMKPLLAHALSIYNQYYFPSGVPASPYPDAGDTQGYGILNTGSNSTANSEEWAVLLAFGSQVDPSAANRMADAAAARNLLMYALNLAAQGPVTNAPFQDPLFPTYNRANLAGEEWPLIVDWIYNAKDASNNPVLTAADKATIQKAFMLWCQECEHAYTNGGDHPSPIGVTNSLSLLPHNLPYRPSSNNYYLGHEREMTMMSLCLDPADDPAIAQPASQIGNSLRSYISEAIGAWLYQTYSMMGEPATIAADYGVPNNPTGAGFGLSSGGMPVEGFLYGHSYGFILEQLWALQTAGFNDTNISGPQIKLIGAPVWDRFVTAYMSSLSPTAQVPPSESYLGPVYLAAGYGDLLREWITPDSMQPFALLSLLDHENGVTAHDNADRWFAQNALPGGQSQVIGNITNPFTWGVMQSLLYFMLLDPAAPPATDPRPSFPTYFLDAPQSRIMAHSDWTPNGTIFDYFAPWISINHQNNTGGEFEFFRQGEWLTKEMCNYDNNDLGQTTYYHNTLGLQNWCANGSPNLQFYESGIWANGGQWMEGNNAGDPASVNSTGSGYVYASSDLTNLYNKPNSFTPANGAVDITQANRSIIWLNNDYIVIYDRAASLHPNLFKRFNLSLITNPVINGHVATETMTDGQKLFIQTLLPATATSAARQANGDLNPLADLEPAKYVLTIEDTSNPSSIRFLHVLQGADSGTGMTTATTLQSTSGTPCDGAIFGPNAVYFPVNTGGAFAATTFPTPAGVHTLIVTGLSPNAGYGVTIGAGFVTITPGGAAAVADGAGLLKVSF